jgi:hypothetical protein
MELTTASRKRHVVVVFEALFLPHGLSWEYVT